MQTEALGAKLARSLRPGDVVVVEGELGVGKTTLVRGACRELGVSGIVTSPTFTIGQRYPAPTPVSHLDLFRISSLDKEDPELLADYVGPEAISFIELPPQQQSGRDEISAAISALGTIAARVMLAHAGGDRRLVQVES